MWSGNDSLSDAVTLLSLRRPKTTATREADPPLNPPPASVSTLATPRHAHKDDSSLRPRAPIHPQSGSSYNRQAAEDKRNISELWKSLDDFSRSSANDFDSADSYYNESNSSEVHFLNIDSSMSKSRFVRPELPTGQVVKINIISTWGDPHYLGLTGIEIFDDCGATVTHARTKIYDTDTHSNDRSIERLLDGVNNTCDERHAWLVPYTHGRDHMLFIELDRPCAISMIRIWNYNKSRPHAARGARYAEIFLDGYTIFKGEVKRALGSHSAISTRDCCESIAFTRSRGVLDAIEANDQSRAHQQQTRDEGLEEEQQQQQVPSSRSSFCLPGERPATSNSSSKSSSSVRPSTAAAARRRLPISCRSVDMVIRSNWGDFRAVGLSRLSAVGEDFQDLELPLPHSLFWGSLDSCGAVTVERELPLPRRGLGDEALLVSYPEQGAMRRVGGVVVLRFDLGASIALRGLKVWNYCDFSDEGAFMGAKLVTLYVDGLEALSCIVRKAPGDLTRRFDYHQFLPLNCSAAQLGASSRVQLEDADEDNESSAGDRSGILFFDSADSGAATGPRCCEELQQYETPVHPSGSLVKIVILSNHGDRGFVSIDGLLLYDRSGWPVFVDEEMVQAAPYNYVMNPLQRNRARGYEAVCLEGWAAPLATQNVIYILFDEPVTISLLKIFNCSRRPERGIRDLELYIDDEVVFKGALNTSSPQGGEGWSHPFYTFKEEQEEEEYRGVCVERGSHQSVLFTNDPETCERERPYIPKPEEDMLFIDGGVIAEPE